MLSDASIAVIAASISASIASTVAAVLAYLKASKAVESVEGVDGVKAKVQEIHVLFNSRMDELLKLTGESNRAEGVIEGTKAEVLRQMTENAAVSDSKITTGPILTVLPPPPLSATEPKA